MSVAVEALFTSALGLQPPWLVDDVKLDTAKRRIDFEVACRGALLGCPQCGAAAQPVHDRLRRSWRHLDFFQFEAWLHADVPRVACAACGKTTQLSVPWARPGSGFTAAFEALALALCRELPVRQAAALLRCSDKQLWLRIEFYVEQARALEELSGVEIIGIDETSLRRAQDYITVVHDLGLKRLLFATEGRDHQTVLDFAADLKTHGGEPAELRHVCMDMSAAYAKGVALALANAAISYDRFHVVAMAIDAMDQVRRAEMRDEPAAVDAALGDSERKTIKGLMWAMRKNPAGVAAEDGAARGLCARPSAQQRRARRQRPARLAELGPALSARTIQETRHHHQGALRRGGARHDRSPQQRLRRGHERAVATGQARRAGLSHEQELHRHCLPAAGQTQASARSPVRARLGEMTMSCSTRNGIEPCPAARHVAPIALGGVEVSTSARTAVTTTLKGAQLARLPNQRLDWP